MKPHDMYSIHMSTYKKYQLRYSIVYHSINNTQNYIRLRKFNDLKRNGAEVVYIWR